MRTAHGIRILIGVALLAAVVGCEVRFGGDERGADPARSDDVSGANATALEVPDAPVAGTIHGQAFAYQDASIEQGILTIRQGEDFFADLKVTLFLFLEDDEHVPEGRSWDVNCEGSWGAGDPHIHVSWRDDDQGVPQSESKTCDYRLYLKLGEETEDKRLPGELLVRIPGLDTEIAGHFEAAIEGFRIVDGQVDLSQDDLDVAHHLAETWLAEQSGGPIEVIDHAMGWLHLEQPKSGPQAGYSVYWWRPEGGGETQIAKLQFAKRDGTWRVERALEPWQVAEARKLSTPAHLSASLKQRSAQRFEEEHVAANGQRAIFVTKVETSYNPQAGLAEVTVRYTLDPQQARESSGFMDAGDERPTVRYLFRTTADGSAAREPDAWRLDRRLEPDEKVDYQAGRVVK